MSGPDLGKMVGPLPLGAWLAAGGVGIGAGVYLNLKKKKAATAGASVLDTTALGPAGTVAVVPNGGILLPNSANPTPGNVPLGTDLGSGKPTDNAQWEQLAMSTMVASGYDAALVARSLATYLAGHALDTQQQAIIDLVLKKIGLPPMPPPLAPTMPSTQPSTSTPNVTLASLGLPQSGSFTILIQEAGSPSVFMYYPGPGAGTPWLHLLSADEVKYASGVLHFQTRVVAPGYIAAIKAALPAGQVVGA